MNKLPQPVARGLVLAAFWIPLTICLLLACTPNPQGLAARFTGAAAHVAAFAYLAAALFRAHFDGPGDQAMRILAVALWMLAFGVVIEVAQLLLVAGRSGELADLVMDAAGIAAGTALYFAWAGMRRPALA